MTPLTLYLAKLIGAYMVILSLWMAARKEVALELVDRLVGDPVGVSLVGMLRLAIGLAIVLGHDVWSGGALPVVITLIGWAALLNGLLTLFAPPEAVRRIFSAMQFERRYPIFAGVALLLGLYLAIGGFAG
jgi:hypothetical protein